VDFAELEQRIELLCGQAVSREYEPGLVAEIEGLLAEGYLRALEGDQATRRLRFRLAVMHEHLLALQAGTA
jgi:hypothetical protein